MITADQIGSRSDIDRAGTLLRRLNHAYGERLVRPFDQTAGDEIQAIVGDPATTLELVLELARDGHWSVGLGAGRVRTPIPATARTATGPAFIAARAAVEAAKRADGRVALHDAGGDTQNAPTTTRAADVEPFLRMLVVLRGRRSPEGWEIVDLVETGLTQKAAARRLGISAQAANARLKAAMWAIDRDARPALVRLLDELDTGFTR